MKKTSQEINHQNNFQKNCHQIYFQETKNQKEAVVIN